MRKKSLLRRLIPWMIAAVLIALLVIFVGIPLYGQQEEEVNDPPTVSYFEDSGLDLTLENDYLWRTIICRLSWILPPRSSL